MLQQDAIEHLETFGYCLIENALSAAQAGEMVKKYSQLHQDFREFRFSSIGKMV